MSSEIFHQILRFSHSGVHTLHKPVLQARTCDTISDLNRNYGAGLGLQALGASDQSQNASSDPKSPSYGSPQGPRKTKLSSRC
jgi:hypothetical protein